MAERAKGRSTLAIAGTTIHALYVEPLSRFARALPRPCWHSWGIPMGAGKDGFMRFWPVPDAYCGGSPPRVKMCRKCGAQRRLRWR